MLHVVQLACAIQAVVIERPTLVGSRAQTGTPRSTPRAGLSDGAALERHAWKGLEIVGSPRVAAVDGRARDMNRRRYDV